jgi:hypothetical protein
MAKMNTIDMWFGNAFEFKEKITLDDLYKKEKCAECQDEEGKEYIPPPTNKDTLKYIQ